MHAIKKTKPNVLSYPDPTVEDSHLAAGAEEPREQSGALRDADDADVAGGVAGREVEADVDERRAVHAQQLEQELGEAVAAGGGGVRALEHALPGRVVHDELGELAVDEVHG